MHYLLALFQTAVPVLPVGPSTGVPTVPMVGQIGLTGFLGWLWWKDKSDRAAERELAEKRYDALAQDWKRIVQDNTTALTKLADAVSKQVKVDAAN